VMGFDPDCLRMNLLATQPGVSVQDVIDNTGFELIIPDQIEQNPSPTEAELEILRQQVDKDRLYI
jgi:glutaconate CoA-transferase, subunit B